MLQAIGFNIVAQDIIEPEEDTTESGIFIPKYSSVSQVKKAKVISSDIDSISKNEIILYMKGTGMPVSHDGKEYLIIQEQNIIAKIIEG